MKILVTGATGFLGRSLMRQRHTAERVGCSRRPCEQFVPSYVQVDLTDGKAVSNGVYQATILREQLLAQLRPVRRVNRALRRKRSGRLTLTPARAWLYARPKARARLRLRDPFLKKLFLSLRYLFENYLF